MNTTPDRRTHVEKNLDVNLIRTSHFNLGRRLAKGAVAVNGLVAIDGPPGTGKTTCVRYFAETIGIPSAIITMAARPAPLDMLRQMHRAITGLEATGTRYQMQRDLLPILNHWDGVLIVDECQTAQVMTMQQITWLWEESQQAFPMVLVGTGILDALARYPQLKSRLMGHAVFAPLADNVLLDTVRALDHRLQDIPTSDLLDHDRHACHGLLRRWAMTVRWLDAHCVTTTATSRDLHAIASLLPTLD
ncbi:ATP-binding protein [Phycicoccus duodecadis]|uniref:AAA domain-containing protein n=1 Tax=Phycicoccus duodecadis TaxID=173053 RepID=A0A2N3YFY9_9MICO|nr:ATP-binding protein [Phycicoccus duodecadis]PKW25749.1 AAA domain-containing protein [Phycicoccus duodecadis]